MDACVSSGNTPASCARLCLHPGLGCRLIGSYTFGRGNKPRAALVNALALLLGGKKGTRGRENLIGRLQRVGRKDALCACEPAGAPSGLQGLGATSLAGATSSRHQVARRQSGNRMRRSHINRSAFKNIGTVKLSCQIGGYQQAGPEHQPV